MGRRLVYISGEEVSVYKWGGGKHELIVGLGSDQVELVTGEDRYM